MGKIKKQYRFNVDTNFNMLPGSTVTNPKFLLKIPATVKNGRLFVEWGFLDPEAGYIATMPQVSGIVIRSSSFGTHEYSDSSAYGVIYAIDNIKNKISDTVAHVFFYNSINVTDVGYRMNQNVNLNGLVVELNLTLATNVNLTSTQWDRFRFGFLIIDDDERI